jgi:hypothetical protein
MAFNLENMTVDYKKLLNIVPTQRMELAQSGAIDNILSVLTPGQLVSLFPRYYRQQLPDVGQINKYAASLDVALSGSPSTLRQQRTDNVTTYGNIPSPGLKKTMTPEEKAIQAAISEAGLLGTGAVISGTDGIKDGRQQRMKMSYDAFTAAGFSHKQAIALTAEVGRENGYQEKYMFGTHSDPYNSATNLGMLSMQGPRLKQLKDHLMEEGRFGPDGELLRDQETMNAMARFYMKEMNSTENSKKTKEFLSNPDIDPERAAYLLGTGYIRWRYDDPRYAHHKGYTEKYYNETENITGQFELAADNIKGLETVIAKFEPGMLEKLDTRLQEHYKNASAQQQGMIERTIERIGIDRFNELMKQQPVNDSTLSAASATPIEGSRISEDQAGFRKLPIKPELRNALEYAAEQSGLQIKVFSGGQDMDIHDAMEEAGNPSSYRHNIDIKGVPGAADVFLQYRDKNGKLITLSATNPDHAPLIADFTKNFSRVIPSAGVGANYMKTEGRVDPTKFHFGGPNAPGGAPATWSQKNVAIPEHIAKAHTEGVALRDADLKSGVDPLKEWVTKKEEERAKKIAQTAEELRNSSPVNIGLENAEVNDQAAKANSVPAMATGGLKDVPPGENIAGVNTNTGKIEFMANDRERIRVDPATLENKQQYPVITQEDTERLETSPAIEAVPARPEYKDNPDPMLGSTMSGNNYYVPPSQLRAANRAKLYGEDSSGLVNGHFA